MITLNRNISVSFTKMNYERFYFNALVLYLVGTGIGIFGIIGNIIAFIGFQKQSKKTATSLLFQVLAISDSLVLTVTCPYTLLLSYNRAMNNGYSTSTLAYVDLIAHPLSEMAILASISVTEILSITRLTAVCFPLHARRLCTITRVRGYLVVAFVFAVVFNIHHYIAGEIVTTVYQNKTMQHVRVRSNYKKYHRPLELILRPAVYCAIPILLISVITIALIIKLKSVDQRRAKMTLTQRRSNKATRVLIAVLVVFILCSLPYPVAVLCQLTPPFYTLYTYMYMAVPFFYIINSSVNFLIYTTLCNQYRRAIFQSCCSCPRPTSNIIERRQRRREIPSIDMELERRRRETLSTDIELEPRGREALSTDIGLKPKNLSF